MMKRVCIPVLILLALIIVPGAFGQGSGMLEETIARVNADVILQSEYESRLKTIRDNLAQAGPQGQPGLKGTALDQAVAKQQKDLLRNLIDETLLLQRAKELGMSADLEIVRTMERLRVDNKFATTEDLEKAIAQQGNSVDDFKQAIGTRYLVSRVIQEEVYNRIKIAPEDLKTYYDAHTDDFNRPAGVSLAQIVVSSDRKKIDAALAALKKGDDFAAVAQKYSEDSSAIIGGALPFMEKDKINPDYADTVSKLAHDGDFSDIFTSPSGWVILKLQYRHESGILPFEAARADIQSILYAQRSEQKLREYLTKLRDDGVVSVNSGYTDTGDVKGKSGSKPQK